MSSVWFAALAAGGAGVSALAFVAVGLRRDVTALQNSMKPLRTGRAVRPADRPRAI